MAEVKQLSFADGVDVTPPTASADDVQKTVFDVEWPAATKSVVFDLTDLSSHTVTSNNVADARVADWSFWIESSGSYEKHVGANIVATSATSITVSFGIAPDAGTYRIKGVG